MAASTGQATRFSRSCKLVRDEVSILIGSTCRHSGFDPSLIAR
jgi:hypothetical protein